MPPHSGGICGSHSPASRAADAQGEQLAVVGAPVRLPQGVRLDTLLGWSDDVVDERPNTAAQAPRVPAAG